jgi:DNA modification methylase
MMMQRCIRTVAGPARWFTLPSAGGSSIVMVAQLNRIGFDCEIDRGYVAVELERLSL